MYTASENLMVLVTPC